MLHLRHLALSLSTSLFLAVSTAAQGPQNQSGEVQLSATQINFVMAPPSTAATLIPFQVAVEGREDDGFELKEVPDEFQGRGYKRTGEWWSKVMLSPDKGLLTALTYTSPEKPERGHPIFGGGEPTRGEFFGDVYETGSGEKMASGSLTFSEITPGVISDTALWVDERYLLLPLDESAQSCLLIVQPEN